MLFEVLSFLSIDAVLLQVFVSSSTEILLMFRFWLKRWDSLLSFLKYTFFTVKAEIRACE